MTVGNARARHAQIFLTSGHDSGRSQVRVECSPDDMVGDLKKLIAIQTGTDATKIVLKKWYANVSHQPFPDIRRVPTHSRSRFCAGIMRIRSHHVG